MCVSMCSTVIRWGCNNCDRPTGAMRTYHLNKTSSAHLPDEKTPVEWTDYILPNKRIHHVALAQNLASCNALYLISLPVIVCACAAYVRVCTVCYEWPHQTLEYTAEGSGQHQLRATPQSPDGVSPLHLNTTIYRSTAHSQTHIHKPFTTC